MRRRGGEKSEAVMLLPQRGTYQGAPCMRCGGRLEPRVLGLWEATYSGQTQIVCTACGTVETPAMRAQLRPPLTAEEKLTAYQESRLAVRRQQEEAREERRRRKALGTHIVAECEWCKRSHEYYHKFGKLRRFCTSACRLKHHHSQRKLQQHQEVAA